MIDKLAWICLQDGKILSTRSKGKAVWYIPGGKRERGESDTEALKREIKEELQVELMDASIQWLGEFYAQADGHPAGLNVRMRCYTADYKGDLQASAEIAEYDWLSMIDLFRISAVDRKIFEFLFQKELLLKED
ncbi:MAG: NUDIX domain-containing protein [Bacteroidota bacterium]